MAGDELGGIGGAAGAAVGSVAGMAGGMTANDAMRGMPDHMLVGVTRDAVYGFAGAMTRAGAMSFQVKRQGLKAVLEGNRLPLTHSKDVIAELTG